MMETVEEEKLIAAARLIMREVDSNRKLSHKVRKILVDLRTKLSSISTISEDEELSDIKKQIDSIKDKMIWNYRPDEVKEYLKEVGGVRRSVEKLRSLNPRKDSKERKILMKANDVLHRSMPRIEELFTRMLVHNRYNFVPRRFRSSEDDGVDESSIVSLMDDSVDDSIQRDGKSKGGKVYIMHLIDPEVIPDLKSIANLMFGMNYGRECSAAFISVRKDALDDLLFILEKEKSSIEDVLKMEGVALSSKIKRWTKAMWIFIRIYLASEKLLCEQIFGQGESISSLYFSESSKASILQFLNFAEAFAVGNLKHNFFFKVLHMHDSLADLTPNIKSSYPDENGSYLRTKFQDVLNRKWIILENGSLLSILESSLEEKSRLYTEDALGHLFLMNNYHYMGEKVKGSKLLTILGDDWILKHMLKVQQYAMSYERSTWSPILKLLTDEGLYGHSGSSNPLSKTLLKERLDIFYTAFEEIYKTQTGWLIPNNQLREEMRISISLKICEGYRNFIGRFRIHINEKYIKYSAEDLENYLLDLFEGSATSL